MKMSINLEVLMKDGDLILTDKNGRTITFTKEQIVQRKISMVVLGELSKLPKIQIARSFGYATRKSYYDIRNEVLNGTVEDIIPEQPGPKPASKR